MKNIIDELSEQSTENVREYTYVNIMLALEGAKVMKDDMLTYLLRMALEHANNLPETTAP